MGDKEVIYNQSTCPKSARWFEQGGRCGWARECCQCKDNPDVEECPERMITNGMSNEAIEKVEQLWKEEFPE